MDNRKKIQIFISSTYLDLLSERQSAVEAILKAGHIPAGMELFTASNKSQWDIITRWIDESDVYMLILGGRYGSIEQKSGKSYTHLEYEYAQSRNKPLFAVVIEDSMLEKLPVSCTERDNPDKLLSFRKKVLSSMSAFFTDTKDIKLAIHESLGQINQDYDLTGWIRSNNKSSDFSNEIVKLNDEIRKLKKDNEKLIAQQVARIPDLFVDINGSQKLVFSLNTDSSRGYSPIEPILEVPKYLTPYLEENLIENYNESLQKVTSTDIEIYNEIQSKISLLLDVQSRKNISINISNKGNIKAKTVCVTLSFPNLVYISKRERVDFDFINELDEQASKIIPTQKYHPLELAKKNYEKNSNLRSRSGLGVLRPHEHSIASNVIHNMSVNTNKTFDSDSISNNKITIKLSELMHGLNSIYENYYIIPLKVGSEYIEIELLCEEYLETRSYKIPLTVS